MVAQLAKDPENVLISNALGYAWADQGRNLDEAQLLIELAVRGQPHNSAFLDSLGWVFYKKGQFGDAVKRLEEAANAPNGMNPVILDHLGDALYRAGHKEQAARRWAQARQRLEKEPRFAIDNDPEMSVVGDRVGRKLEAFRSDAEAPVAPIAADEAASDGPDEQPPEPAPAPPAPRPAPPDAET